MVFITIQEAAKLLNCSTRTVYRKIDEIDTFNNLVDKGFAKRENTNNGNTRRLFSKEWLNSTFDKNVKARQSKINSLDVNAFDLLKNQLEIKDKQIEAKDKQIEELQNNMNLALHRIAELQKYFHLNGLENGPTLTPTKKYLEEHPDSTLNFNPKEEIHPIDEAEEIIEAPEEETEKSLSDWLKSFR